jgi:hypothetical protein
MVEPTALVVGLQKKETILTNEIPLLKNITIKNHEEALLIISNLIIINS